MSGPQRKLMGPPEIVMAIKAYLFFFFKKWRPLLFGRLSRNLDVLISMVILVPQVCQ